MKIDQKTDLYGVAGYPLGHSLSPVMHNAAFSAMGVNAAYLAFETRDIKGCVRGMRALGIRGMSVTIPHKTAVISLLDEVDELALKIGAVNTIVNRDGYLTGYNTDAVGALRALEEKTDLSGKNCILVGAGGAARAIGYILRDRGVELKIVNRSSKRGVSLSKALSCAFVPMDGIGDLYADILINTTPVGMSPHGDKCPVPEHIVRGGMTVMDIIYNPLTTRLLAVAAVKGCSIVNGLGMFIRQGVEQSRLWTGLEPPVVAMTDAVKQALGSGK